MAIGSEKLNSNYSIKDYIRFLVGDKDSSLFSDKELTFIIEDHLGTQAQSSGVVLTSNTAGTVYRRTSCRTPVYLTSIYEDATDVTDNSGVFVQEGPFLKVSFDTAPTGTVTATFYKVDFPRTMRDIYLAIASDKVKVSVFQSFGDITIDQSTLEQQLRQKAYHWQGISSPVFKRL